MMATHKVITSGPEPAVLVRATRGNTTGGTWELENLSDTNTVYIGHEKVSTSGENRGWSIAPNTRTRVDLVSSLYVVSDEPSAILAFKSNSDGPVF